MKKKFTENMKTPILKTLFENRKSFYVKVSDGYSKSGNECLYGLSENIFKITLSRQQHFHRKCKVKLTNTISKETKEATLVVGEYNIKIHFNDFEKTYDFFPSNTHEELLDCISESFNGIFGPSWSNNEPLNTRVRNILIKRVYSVLKSTERNYKRYYKTFHKWFELNDEINRLYRKTNSFPEKYIYS